MKLTTNIEVSGITKIVICGAMYYRNHPSESFRRVTTTVYETFTAEQMAIRVRKLLASGMWRLWIHDKTINLVLECDFPFFVKTVDCNGNLQRIMEVHSDWYRCYYNTSDGFIGVRTKNCECSYKFGERDSLCTNEEFIGFVQSIVGEIHGMLERSGA